MSNEIVAGHQDEFDAATRIDRRTGLPEVLADTPIIRVKVEPGQEPIIDPDAPIPFGISEDQQSYDRQEMIRRATPQTARRVKIAYTLDGKEAAVLDNDELNIWTSRFKVLSSVSPKVHAHLPLLYILLDACMEADIIPKDGPMVEAIQEVQNAIAGYAV